MAASNINVSYTAYIISGSTKYNVTPLLDELERMDAEGQIAQQVTLYLKNVQVNGKWLTDIFQARDRVFIYANDGSKEAEVFRGYLWGNSYVSSNKDRFMRLKAYDNLIYLQESEDSLYFTAGKSTKDVVSSICSKWGIKLSYSYNSITHSKLPLRGRLYDLIATDILDPVKKRTGKKYVVLSDQDTMHVKPEGSNTTVYEFRAKKNVTSTSSGWTMNGVITQVVIVGKADDDDREPVEATVKGDTSKYGTLQKIQDRNDETSLADAKKDAQATIDEHGKPKGEHEIIGPDIPWIRRGDKVYSDAGDLGKRHLIVISVDRTYTAKKCTMTLTLTDP